MLTHMVLNVVVRPLAGRRAGLLSGPNEEGPRALLLGQLGHRFGDALAIGTGWSVLHALAMVALSGLAVLASLSKEGTPAAGQTRVAQLANLRLVAAWQATTQTCAQLGFTLLVARNLWLVLATTLVHTAWALLTGWVWKLPRQFQLAGWFLTGPFVLVVAAATWWLWP